MIEYLRTPTMHPRIADQELAQRQKLHDLVLDADDRTVSKVIHDRPSCAVAKLADIVSAALPLWDYARPLLQSLCMLPLRLS